MAYSSGRGQYDTEFKQSFGEKAFTLREKDQEREALLDRRKVELYNGKSLLSYYFYFYIFVTDNNFTYFYYYSSQIKYSGEL